MIGNKFPFKKILILVTILAVPGFLYYLLQEKGQNRYKPLPIYGPKVIAETFHKKRGKEIPDTIYHQIKPFEAINQNGDVFYLDSVKEQIIIANFFYTRCTKGCPIVNENLKWLQSEYNKNDRVRFISITVDPTYDREEVLTNYAKKVGAKAGRWDVLNADTSIIYPLAREQFFVNALPLKDQVNFIHSDKLILLDQSHRIRGYYNGISAPEIKKMGDEIKLLITEELRELKINVK